MSQSRRDQVEWVPWPKEDEIRWVDWRIREREAIEAGRSPDWSKSGRWELKDYKAWLLHERDGLSFQTIGDMLFPKYAGDENRKMRAYRAYNRVEGEFRRGNLKRGREAVEFWISGFGIVTKASG